eukprot:SAG11_NODE_33137_length_279_cov_0.572222_1_plen_36_part_10
MALPNIAKLSRIYDKHAKIGGEASVLTKNKMRFYES